jgi:serine protease Do
MNAPVSSGLARDIAAAVDRLRQITVQIRTHGAAIGAGILWKEQGSESGLIITNAHVVRGDGATVELNDGTTARARVVARDRKRDLAALGIDIDAWPALALSEIRESPLRVGELVIAIGHPGGLVGAATLGIVHAAEGARDGRARWVRADLRLAPGFSGGPLADAAGRLVGVNTMIQGSLALAVPAAVVEAWLRRTQVLVAS